MISLSLEQLLFSYSTNIYWTNVCQNSTFKNKFNVRLPLKSFSYIQDIVSHKIIENKIKQNKDKDLVYIEHVVFVVIFPFRKIRKYKKKLSLSKWSNSLSSFYSHYPLVTHLKPFPHISSLPFDIFRARQR